jgi:hypothetical protein
VVVPTSHSASAVTLSDVKTSGSSGHAASDRGLHVLAEHWNFAFEVGVLSGGAGSLSHNALGSAPFRAPIVRSAAFMAAVHDQTSAVLRRAQMTHEDYRRAYPNEVAAAAAAINPIAESGPTEGPAPSSVSKQPGVYCCLGSCFFSFLVAHAGHGF